MRVKPAPGVVVRDPDLKDFLPEGGRDVPDTPYWNRLLHVFGDVTLVDPASEENKP
jgi:hypothetical protein